MMGEATLSVRNLAQKLNLKKMNRSGKIFREQKKLQ
jgi:cytidylate kinase